MIYTKGIKYQLFEDEPVRTEILGCAIDTDYYSLTPDGVLTAFRGYAWDGSSGAIDTANSMLASLFHDALCQCIGREELPLDCLDAANELYYEICLSKGMSRIRAGLQFKAIEFHFRNGVKPEGDRELFYA